jgi:uncharacterized membrane protein SpoIIM required for sporulation
MWRVVLSFFRGVCLSALLLGAVSVYVFHDVDKDLIGKCNIAFRYLAGEVLFFGLLVTLGTAILTQIGRMVAGLRPAVPPTKLGFIVGVSVGLVQYPFEFLVRKVANEHYDFWIYTYIGLSILVPFAVFIAACRKPHPPAP